MTPNDLLAQVLFNRDVLHLGRGFELVQALAGDDFLIDSVVHSAEIVELDVLLWGLLDADYNLDFGRVDDRGLCVLSFKLSGDGRLL